MSSAVPTDLIDALKQRLGPAGWSEDASELKSLLTDQRKRFQGNSPLVLKPNDTEQVSEILRLCHAAGVPVVPQGGNTGHVGGAVPHEDGGQLLLNLSRMNRILSVDTTDMTMVVEAGAILQTIQDKAAETDLLFPLSLAAQGSCTIGGNLSTNAGGINVIRYGNARDLVLGLEAVLADGRVWNGLTGLRKNNTGYDLRHLLIGAEGTLGVITKASLKLFPAPADLCTALVAVRSPTDALALLSRARKISGDGVTAFELMSRFAFSLPVSHLPDRRDPFDAPHPWYVLIELTTSRPDGGLRALMESLLERALTDGSVLDAVIAGSSAQSAALWAIRESIPEAQKHEGASIKHDVSVPVSRVPIFLDTASQAVVAALPGLRPCPFGHVGDGNIHFNLTRPPHMADAAFFGHQDRLNRIVHDIVADLDGSISAEHGIGRLKVQELAHYADPTKLAMMAAIKHALDPGNILNPGKLVARPGPL